MCASGFTRNFTPLKILSEEQIQDIHRGTLSILEKTGLRIEHERALKLLEKNGCKVDFLSRRVKFPPGLVEECMRRCPSSFRLKARNPKNDMIVGGNTVYFGPFPGMQTIDLDTWEPRPPTRKEFYDGVTILDALENVHYIHVYSPWFGFDGLPAVMCLPEGFAAEARNSSKVLRSPSSKDCEIFCLKMAKIIGTDAPVSCCCSSPLTLYTEAVEALYRALEADFPVFPTTSAFMGGTAPVTIAGAVLTNNAELLGGLVLAQLVKPGAKIVMQNMVSPQNMRSGLPCFGAIENSLHNVVFNQYFRTFQIPITNCSPGISSSKMIDYQIGYEKAIGGIISALSGANIITFHGGIYGELTFHPIQAILDDDIAGMIGRFLQGVDVNNDTLALDLIHEVGQIPGHYLDKEHTRKRWKTEFFLPEVADRLSLPDWIMSGKKIAIDYAKERMREILATHKPSPLTPKQEAELEEVLEEARQYYTKKGMM